MSAFDRTVIARCDEKLVAAVNKEHAARKREAKPGENPSRGDTVRALLVEAIEASVARRLAAGQKRRAANAARFGEFKNPHAMGGR